MKARWRKIKINKLHLKLWIKKKLKLKWLKCDPNREKQRNKKKKWNHQTVKQRKEKMRKKTKEMDKNEGNTIKET